MKLLLDFLPLLLFFGTFKYADSHKDWAAQFATDNFGFLVSDGKVGPDKAAVHLATVVVVLATLAWASFKAFGTTGLILIFTLAQGIYLSRHLPEARPETKPEGGDKP